MAFYVDWMQPAIGDAAINVPAATFRMVPQALCSAPGVQGAIAPVSALVTQRGAGANFSVDIQVFSAVVAGDDFTDQGSYVITNSAVFNIVTPNPPGSGTRIHRLIAQVRDKRANGTWTTYDWTPVILQDSGSGEPAEPASALTLAHISIAAGQANVANANITQGYPVLRSLQSRAPLQSLQAGVGAWNNTNTWSDFSGGNWPAVTFTVPPSGRVLVTVSGGLNVINGSTMLGWRISGVDTVAHANTHGFGGGGGAGLFRGSRCFLASGLTPGASDVVTPGWFQNQSGNTDLVEGNLIVEAVD